FASAEAADVLRAVAEEPHDLARLARAIEAHRARRDVPRAKARVEPHPADATTPAPGTGDALERALLDIWRRVLGNAGIGPHDNFFDAGGTSLKAVQVLATVKRELGRDLSVVSLFETPTVAGLAGHLRGEGA